MDEELIIETQNNELYALDAIYSSDLLNLRKGKHASWRPLELQITIKPQQSDSPDDPLYVQVDLYVNCGNKYPVLPPKEISFKNCKGLSEQLIKSFQQELIELARKEAGEVVIFKLIQRTSEFLTEHNKQGPQSFYDEMLSNRKRIEDQIEEDRKKKDEFSKQRDEEQKKKIQQEIQKKQQMVRFETRLRRESTGTKSPKSDYQDIDSDTSETATSIYVNLQTSLDDDFIQQKEDSKSSRSYLTSMMSQSKYSRSNDYEVLGKLGSGGFGDVFKVKHKLDKSLYALKKIKLDPSNKSQNEKILREVVLLSRLNHENIVRYYSAWIETEEIDFKNTSPSGSSGDSTPLAINKGKSEDSCLEIDSSDDLTDEEGYLSEGNIFGTSFLVKSEEASEYVIFENDTNEGAELTVTETSKPFVRNKLFKKSFMYIQMELCEKSTLRNAIDTSNVFKDVKRKKRLFREIVEGLVHIHGLKIIHRDLKPGNIFLDAHDQVKIGDFGLARTLLPTTTTKIENYDQPGTDVIDFPTSKSICSGMVGTPFYIAPELSTRKVDISTNFINYTEKVDMYSLGIIMFEMCYPPPETGMERNKILSDLRKQEIIFPCNYTNVLTEEEIQLLRSLLQHDESMRPSSLDLLKSPYIPPPEMEEKKQQNVILQCVKNPSSKSFKYMLNLLFEKEPSEIDEYVYDISDEMFDKKSKKAFNNPETRRRVFEYVCYTIENVLRRYGAIRFSIPTFMPNSSSKHYDTEDIFKVIDHNGAVISLPYDLRLPFARYIARHKVRNLIRYTIEKVYIKRQVNYHPKEFWICAFDIVSQHTAPQIIPDVECIFALKECILEFQSLVPKSLSLKINHVKLWEAILLYCDIPLNAQNRVAKILSDSASSNIKYPPNFQSDHNATGTSTIHSRSYITNRLSDEKIITDQSKINSFFQLIDIEEVSIFNLNDIIRTVMRKKQTQQVKALSLAKEALNELKAIINCLMKNNAYALKIKICPYLNLLKYGVHRYTGIVFQLEYEKMQTKRNFHGSLVNTLAVGGRYDNLIEEFKFNLDETELPMSNVGGVGFSLEIEKIVRFVIENETDAQYGQTSSVDVALWIACSPTLIVKQQVSFIVREMRSLGHKICSLPQGFISDLDSLEKFCSDNLIKYCVILTEYGDSSSEVTFEVKIIACEKDKPKKGNRLTSTEVIEFIHKAIKEHENGIESCSVWQSIGDSPTNLTSVINVNFITVEKLPSIVRKRHEGHIITLLTALTNFNPNTILEVLASDLPFKVMKTIIAEIEFDDENADSKNPFEESKSIIIEKHQRHRKNISNILMEIFNLKVVKKCPLIVLYSYIEKKFKLL